jgi:hypothetical protein
MTLVLFVVFVLAVGISLGGTLLIIESRENSQTSAEVGSLRAEVDRLQNENQMQNERLAYLEEIGKQMRELPPEPKRDTALAQAPSGNVSEILARLPEDANLKATLAELSREQAKQALADERRAEEEARQKEREEHRRAMQERTEKWLTETYTEHLKLLVKELDLNGFQEGDIRAALDERKEGIKKLYSQRGGPHGRDDGANQPDRVSWDDINKQYEEKLTQILTPTQMSIYKDKRLDRALSRGGGWGRGRGRDNNRGNRQPRGD